MRFLDRRAIKHPRVAFINCREARISTKDMLDPALLEAAAWMNDRGLWDCGRCRGTCKCGVVRGRYLKAVDRLIGQREDSALENRRAVIDLSMRVRPPEAKAIEGVRLREVHDLREPSGFATDHPDRDLYTDPKSGNPGLDVEGFRVLRVDQTHRRFFR